MRTVVARIQRKFRPLRRNEDGITLIELLVAMILLGILLTVVVSLYVSATNAVSLARAVTGNTKQVSNAMNEASRVIRAGTENPLTPPATPAPAFVSAKKDDVIIYAFINLENAQEQPQMIRLWVDRATGTFMESRWRATAVTGTTRWTFPSNPCLATNVPAGCTIPDGKTMLAEAVPASSTLIFQYFQKNGTPIPVPAAGLSLADRGLVSSVKITLTTQTSLTDASNPVTLENTVGMPNLGFAEES
ncbi:MAG: type II secretion system protein [Microbacteriaceae bacterium]